MQIYFAAPLFCEAEKAFNLRLTDELEHRGFEVFLPQRDGVESSKPPYDEMTNDERRQAIFALDRDKVLEADIFLFVLDGRVPDEGACVELGIAYGQKHLLPSKKLLIGLQTDSRSAFPGGKLNSMVQGSFDYVADDETDLINALGEYRHTRTEADEPS
jgi:nucleoside 2-deoxyribosyltransferase